MTFAGAVRSPTKKCEAKINAVSQCETGTHRKESKPNIDARPSLFGRFEGAERLHFGKT